MIIPNGLMYNERLCASSRDNMWLRERLIFTTFISNMKNSPPVDWVVSLLLGWTGRMKMVITAVVNKAEPSTTNGVVYPPTYLEHSHWLMRRLEVSSGKAFQDLFPDATVPVITVVHVNHSVRDSSCEEDSSGEKNNRSINSRTWQIFSFYWRTW